MAQTTGRSLTGARIASVIACTALTAAACAPVAFQMPMMPQLRAATAGGTAAPTPSAVPIAAEATAEIDAVAAADARFGQADVLALGPVRTAERDLAPDVLRRLLRRGGVRVLDLSGAGELGVEIRMAGGGDSAPRVTGPLLSAAWATRLGSATHLLVSVPPSIERATAFLRATRHFQPGALDAYQASYQQMSSECAAAQQELATARSRYQTDFDEAMRRYQESRSRPLDFSPDESAAARNAFTASQAQLGASAAQCQTLPDPVALRALEGAELPPTSLAIVRVQWDVRVVEVPGGRVVWAARLAREGTDQATVLDAMINSLLEALPWAARAPARTGGRTR